MRRSTGITWALVAVAVLAIAGWSWWSYQNRPIYVSTATAPRPTLGGADAPLKLEVFSDFQCPACKLAEPTVQEVLKTFGDRLYFSYRHYPLLNVHPFALRAALAAECANDQGKFWPYHDKLFATQPAFSRDELVQYARDLGLTIDSTSGFAACLDSRAKNDIVRADMREGDQRGVQATPTFFLNGQPVPDWSQLKSLLQAKLMGGQ